MCHSNERSETSCSVQQNFEIVDSPITDIPQNTAKHKDLYIYIGVIASSEAQFVPALCGPKQE
jgi:hypothetical protein